jgi:hypothetical protein
MYLWTYKIVSLLYVLDLKNNGWNELLSVLINVLENNGDSLRVASIRTLSNICQRLKEKNIRMTVSESEQILLGLTVAVSDSEKLSDVKIEGLKGLRDSIVYYLEHLKDERIRSMLFEKVVKCTKDNDEEVVCLAYQYLIEICKHLYDNLDLYLPLIADYSVGSIQSRVTRVSVIATEFWNALATEEAVRIQQAQGVEQG